MGKDTKNRKPLGFWGDFGVGCALDVILMVGFAIIVMDAERVGHALGYALGTQLGANFRQTLIDAVQLIHLFSPLWLIKRCEMLPDDGVIPLQLSNHIHKKLFQLSLQNSRLWAG